MGTESDHDKTNRFYSSPTSPSEENSEINDSETVDAARINSQKNPFVKNAQNMTNSTFIGDGCFNNVTRDMQEYFK